LSANRRANCDSVATPGVKPTICSGVLIRVGQGDDVAYRRLRRLKKQPFAPHVLEHRPADLIDSIPIGPRHKCRVVIIAESLHPHRHASIDDADDLREA
jgi:hypothetical protein